jgi:hypothetical protein
MMNRLLKSLLLLGYLGHVILASFFSFTEFRSMQAEAYLASDAQADLDAMMNGVGDIVTDEE